MIAKRTPGGVLARLAASVSPLALLLAPTAAGADAPSIACTANSSGECVFPAPSGDEWQTPLSFSVRGDGGSGSTPGAAGPSYTFEIPSDVAVTIDVIDPPPENPYSYGTSVFLQSEGGDGSGSGPSAAGAGGSLVATFPDDATISLTIAANARPTGTFEAINLHSAGGDGADDNENNDSDGAPGGAGGGIGLLEPPSSVVVTTLVSASAGDPTSDKDIRGLSLVSEGGYGGRGNHSVGSGPKGGAGGDAGGIEARGPAVTVGGADTPIYAQNVLGLVVRSLGGRGPNDYNSAAGESQGGGGESDGGSGGEIEIVRTGAVDVTGFATGSDGAVRGISLLSAGGDGGWAFDVGDFDGTTDGGPGGPGGKVSLEIAGDVTVTQTEPGRTGARSAAVLVRSEGGDGGTGQSGHFGGTGGGGGSVAVGGLDHELAATGTGADVLVVRSQGGGGGDGLEDANDSTGGTGGAGGNVDVDFFAFGLTATASSQGSDGGRGIVAQSIGWYGGAGGDGNAIFGSPGSAGPGGDGGTVDLSLDAGTIVTDGTDDPGSGLAFANGVLAQSIGGGGGDGGSYSGIFYGEGGTGGLGGNGGDVTVTLSDQTSSVTTSGFQAAGVLAQSIGGGGGTGGVANSLVVSLGGEGGEGGASGDVSVSNEGRIDTSGYGASGIVVQSITGGGGNAGVADGAVAIGATGGDGGHTPGSASASNTGAIETSGDAASGILVQSVGGGGGNAGGRSSTDVDGTDYGIVSVGGAGGAGGDGGAAAVSAIGRVTTDGQYAYGLHVQSIGGGGGNGGSAFSADVILPSSVAVGGTAGSGGAGGSATVASGGTDAIVTTSQKGSHAILVQSIGGGGGAGGDATGEDLATPVVLGIGGAGGDGGAGGNVSVSLPDKAILSTSEERAHGILAQSVGGGGGTGGDASTTNLLSPVQVAVGGVGGSDRTGSGSGVGHGGTVNVAMSGARSRIVTGLDQSSGILAQSVGGGGGSGGMASGAGADLVSVGVAVGGSGGGGGDGGDVIVGVSDTFIATGTADGTTVSEAHGILAQSIGGGGGHGGGAASKALTSGIPVDPDGNRVDVNAQFAIGGAGGSGGDGGRVDANLGSGVRIVSEAEGGHGLFAQSVGGGGGTGGDAAAATMTVGTPVTGGYATQVSVAIETAVGGKGGSGGAGDAVSATVDSEASVKTTGDKASAVLAQSIGGGGGNSGVPSSVADQIFGQQLGITTTIDVGNAASSGGDGQDVTVNLDEDARLETGGDGGRGIHAQSVGGGGGTAAGGEFKLGGNYVGSVGGSADPEEEQAASQVRLSASLTVRAGAKQGSGGAAGDVTVSTGAETMIDTGGVDADGILAQSVGGGGGVAGTMGSEATSQTLKFPRTRLDVNATFAFGSTGGTGGTGGTVRVTHDGMVMTGGDWADGIVAQSVGGGGGAGGTASASSTVRAVNLVGTLGGTGGSGGDGGGVAVHTADGATINTGGFAAHGILAQSVGGGGGQAGDGSSTLTGELSLGLDAGGAGGAGGTGGAVALYAEQGGGVLVTTGGDGAFGVLAQSVGGGGGLAGGGNATSAVGLTAFSIDLGSKNAPQGDAHGGSVTVNDGRYLISTTGARSHGLVAQSVGGGGGIAGVGPASAVNDLAIGAAQGVGAGSGGDVFVEVTPDAVIATAGEGAHAVIAQSVGGGGGIAGNWQAADASDGADAGNNDAGSGDGGAVTVRMGASSVRASGEEAIAVVAQSVGGGGGLGVAAGDAQAVTGSTASADASGTGGAVAVYQQDGGVFSATGAGGVGLFAQSVGPDGGGAITLSLPGEVKAGSVAILVRGGNADNVLTLDSMSVVDGSPGGVAIRYRKSSFGDGCLTVDGGGRITGSIDVSPNCDPGDATASAARALPVAGEAGAVTIARGGRWFAEGTSRARLVNTGEVHVGRTATLAEARLEGDYVQTADGSLVVGADFGRGIADRLVVDGRAHIDGAIRVAPVTLVAGGPVEVLRATRVTGAATALDSPAVDFEARTRADRVEVSVADTRFADAAAALSQTERRAAAYLDALFDAGATEHGALLAAFDALLTGEDGVGAFGDALAGLSPGATQAPGAASLVQAHDRLSSVLSCPAFGGDGALVGEESCTWSRGGASAMRQSAADGYDGSAWELAAGVQAEVAPGWFAGLAAGYARDWYASADGTRKAEGDTGFIAASLKRERGVFRVSGAITGSYGGFDLSRRPAVPGAVGTARATTDVLGLGARARLGYRLASASAYLEPSVDLDVLHTRVGAYEESGAGPLDLSVDAAAETAFVATPAFEVGLRHDVSDEAVLRAYARLGVSLSTLDDWTTSARFSSAPPAAGTFESDLAVPSVLARFAGGLDLAVRDRLHLRADYEGSVGDSFWRHEAFLRIDRRF